MLSTLRLTKGSRRAPRISGRTSHVMVTRSAFFLVLALALGAVLPTSARAEPRGLPDDTGGPAPEVTPQELIGVDIKENLGGQLPLETKFFDTEGSAVTLGKYFDGKRPVVLVFAYHTCPMLCSLVLDATVKALKDVPWTVGNEFDVVSISFDPKDTPASATAKRAQVVSQYDRTLRGGNGDVKGWHFLTSPDASQIARVTDAVGFQYRYDARLKQYAHPAAIYLLTPDGKVARYLYSLTFDPQDIRLGLLEASQGRSISTTEKLLIYCYQFDPQGKKYTLAAMNIMRLGGAVTVVVLGGVLAVLWRRERIAARAKPTSTEKPS